MRRPDSENLNGLKRGGHDSPHMSQRLMARSKEAILSAAASR